MLIHRVTGLTVYSLPLVFVKTWLIVARGETSTLGWTHARLEEERDADPELATFAFEADPPDGLALQVMSPIIASTIFHPADAQRGVRIRSGTNDVVERAPIYRAVGAGAEEEGEYDFIAYETEFGDLGYEAEDAAPMTRSVAPLMSLAGQHCDRRRLFKIISRIEFKARGLKFYRRERYLTTYLVFCYPTDIGDEAVKAIRDCLPAAILAGVAGASGGPAGAVAAFVAAMKACVGAELGAKVSVKIDTEEEIGDWKRI